MPHKPNPHRSNKPQEKVLDKLYSPLSRHLSNCLKKIKYDLCARCSFNDLKYLQQLGLTNTTIKSDLIHNYSSTNNYLTPTQPFDPIMIDSYFEDTEHGFFHGLCCCLIAYLINSTIDPHTWVSIILHDFLKSNQYTQQAHDYQLRSFYDKLHPITYRHSQINAKRSKWVLIKSDRIELRRYSDYLEWIDDRYTINYLALSTQTQNIIDHFYAHIRPALHYFYTNRKSIFIRHGFEKHDFNSISEFPPSSSYWRQTKSYAIEIDSAPFSNEISIGPAHPHIIWQDNHCSNHGGNHIWNRIKGYITLDSFRTLGGTLHPIATRDHLMAKSNIPIDEWTFIINSRFIPKDVPLIEHLKSSNIKLVDQSILFDFFAIYRLLYNRLTVLNSKIPILHQ